METEILWHSLSVAETLQRLSVDVDLGLTANEVGQRQQLYGSNQLVVSRPPNLWWRFLRQFHHVLVYVLLGAAAIACYLRHWSDMSVILAVVVVDAIFGLIQEGKAEKALSAIRNWLAPMAEVVREGQRGTIEASDLVPGDIVCIRSGDKIPADIRLIETKSLQVQEAILTGEATPLEKSSIAVAADVSLSERYSMLYSGTIVTYGRAMGVVIATGINTEIGKISKLLLQVPAVITPLLRQMDAFGRWLAAGIVVAAIIIFSVGTLLWHDAGATVFMAVVGLVVAAIPEGLPPLLTIILALGVMRMVKVNAIVRHLPAIETMGTVTAICADKTGTLTCNELSVQKIVTLPYHYMVGDDDDHKELFLHDKPVTIVEHPDLATALRSAILCNDSDLLQIENQPRNYSDPLDYALLALHGVAKMNAHFIREAYPRDDVIPYESEHKFMATLHHDHQGQHFIYVKGAPERILKMCRQQQVNGVAAALNLAYWQEQIEQLALQGLKVIAVAFKKLAVPQVELQFKDMDDQFIFIALFGLIDPPRPEARTAIAKCQQAGIRVKMITGDHAATAVTISSLLGIGNAHGILTGVEIDQMSDEELAQVAQDVDIYARVLPQHKLRLVEALQAKGEIVAVTGDGVNDAPALRRADIGIAMGKKGTEIAKEAAEMVLADDNFATIVAAIEEGRNVYDSLKKAVIYILPTGIAQALVVALAILFNWILPLTAIQILWVNMVSTVTLSLSLGFEKKESAVMKDQPRSAKTSILSSFLTWRTLFVSGLLVVAVFALFFIEPITQQNLAVMRTVAVNMIVLGETVYLINCRNVYNNVINFKALFGSKPMWVAIGAVLLLQSLFTYLPQAQQFFSSAAISWQQWSYIAGFSLGIFLLIELEKWIIRWSKNLDF